MLRQLQSWYQRKFSDPDAGTLFLLLLGLALLIGLFGALLAPILMAVALAYLLEWPVQSLRKFGVQRIYAVTLVFLLFVSMMLAILIFFVPVVWQQGLQLLRDMPNMLLAIQEQLIRLPEIAPGFINEYQISELIQSAKRRVLLFGELLIGQSLASLVSVMQLLIYLIVVPLLLFFMLKDRALLLGHLSRALPSNRRLISQVGAEMNLQIMNYIRGKAIEVVIVGTATYLGLWAFDLQYAALLSVLVGLSVLIPYIGAVVVTIPVFLVAFVQFGWDAELGYIMAVYLIIQALDGNVLVPLLFSEAVDLNPVYIIAAVLVFGGLWGFWGVFFAIPLASLVKAVVTALSNQPPQAEAPSTSAATSGN